MTNTFVFKADDAVKFELLYEGFIVGGSIYAKPKGVPLIRVECKILDKLEAISIVLPGAARLDSLTEARTLMIGEDQEATLELDGPELDLLKEYFGLVPWRTSLCRRVIDIIDWLEKE